MGGESLDDILCYMYKSTERRQPDDAVKLFTMMTEVAKTFPQLRYIGDPILATRVEEVTYNEGVEIGKYLGEVLTQYRMLTGMGRGLAANQVGIPASVFVTLLDDGVYTYINPRMTEFSGGYRYYRELCLSSGGIWADVMRPARLKMTYLTEGGIRSTVEVDGFLARLLAHEYDHIVGNLNLHRGDPGSLALALDPPLGERLRDTSLLPPLSLRRYELKEESEPTLGCAAINGPNRYMRQELCAM